MDGLGMVGTTYASLEDPFLEVSQWKIPGGP